MSGKQASRLQKTLIEKWRNSGEISVFSILPIWDKGTGGLKSLKKRGQSVAVEGVK